MKCPGCNKEIKPKLGMNLCNWCGSRFSIGKNDEIHLIKINSGRTLLLILSLSFPIPLYIFTYGLLTGSSNTTNHIILGLYLLLFQVLGSVALLIFHRFKFEETPLLIYVELFKKDHKNKGLAWVVSAVVLLSSNIVGLCFLLKGIISI